MNSTESDPVPAPVRLVLPLVGRGTLPYTLLHGEALWVHALRALVAAGALAATRGVAVARIPLIVGEGNVEDLERQLEGTGLTAEVAPVGAPSSGGGEALLVHDPLCPLTPAEFLMEVLVQGVEGGRSLAAFRPVTDTVKTVEEDRISGTIDRDSLAALASPVFVPARSDRGGLVPLSGCARLVAWLREEGDLALVKAPAIARRVDDESAVNLLECVDELGHRLRHEEGRPPVAPGLSGGTAP